jgi:hypothetical protein
MIGVRISRSIRTTTGYAFWTFAPVTSEIGASSAGQR